MENPDFRRISQTVLKNSINDGLNIPIIKKANINRTILNN